MSARTVSSVRAGDAHAPVTKRMREVVVSVCQMVARLMKRDVPDGRNAEERCARRSRCRCRVCFIVAKPIWKKSVSVYGVLLCAAMLFRGCVGVLTDGRVWLRG